MISDKSDFANVNSALPLQENYIWQYIKIENNFLLMFHNICVFTVCLI